MLVFWIFVTSLFVNVVKLQDCGGTKWAADVEERIRKLEESNELLTEYIKAQNTKLKRQDEINKNQMAENNRLRIKMEEIVQLSKTVTGMQTGFNNSSIHRKRQQRLLDNVAFSTRLTTPLSGLGHHQTVIFNHVITNEGNGYNQDLGVFIAPVNGLYVFTWTVSIKGGKWQSTELVKGGTPYAYSLTDSFKLLSSDNYDPDYSTATNTVVLQVNVGQHVWIRTGSKGDGLLDGNNYDTFSGWLLYQY